VQMRSKALVGVVAAAMSVGLVACGDDEETAATPAATTEQPAETTEGSSTEATQDIVALAQATPDLSTLVDAVTAADLVETLQGEGPFTVFAPTNEAFSALGDTLDTLLLPENREQLASVLTYHVVPSRALAADLSDGQTLETVSGETLEVQVEGDTVTVGGATVTQADIEASNGVVHVIDTVLQPQG
jgi:uncharacterized surface protein with fasciclin (FAS1) repeats